jgi:hypothetical protein
MYQTLKMNQAEALHEDGPEEEEGHKEEGSHGFPLVYILFFVGFMIMLFLDQVIFKPTQKLVPYKKI